MHIRLGLLLLALMQASAEVTPRRAEVPIEGKWRVNLGRTRYGATADPRRRETMACSRKASTLHCVIDSIRADGRTIHGEFSSALGGGQSSVIGIPDVDGVRLDPTGTRILDATFFFREKAVFGYRAMRSDDDNSLIIVAVDPVTRTALTSVVVYDRER